MEPIGSLLGRNRDGATELGMPLPPVIVFLLPGSGQVSQDSRLSGGPGACCGLVKGRGAQTLTKVFLDLEDRETNRTHSSTTATGHN